jgi:type I restriction enzyme R subunit
MVALFRERLGYAYIGNWSDRERNSNIEEGLLRRFLREKQAYGDGLIRRALHLLRTVAGDTSKSLYDRNRDVYNLLRYAVKVKRGPAENTEDVWLVDCSRPERKQLEKVFKEVSEDTIRTPSPSGSPARRC